MEKEVQKPDSTPENTTFLALLTPESKWEVRNCSYEKLALVENKEEVRWFIQRHCQKEYSSKGQYGATICWNENQTPW